MIQTGAAAAAAIGGTSRRFRARLTENGTELGGEIRRVTVHLGSCGGSAFTPGAVFSSYTEITVAGSNLSFEGRTLTLELGVLLSEGSYEYVTLGRFTAGRPSTSVYETTFTAVGSIAARFAGAFVPPAGQTVANVISALEAQTGVSIVLRGLTAAGTIEKDMTGLTCRQALGVVAGVLGGYATERNDGAVVLAKFTGTATVSVDGSRMTALPTFADSSSTVTGVRVTVPADGTDGQSAYASGTPNVERTDAFMTRALFPAYAANLIGLTYRAGTVKLALGDPRLEPWDVLAVTDMANRTFALPCMSIVHTFDGGLSTEVRAPGLAEATEILGAAGLALRSAQETAASAAAAAEAAQGTADAAEEQLAAWAYANDTTKIDGGRIYTGTIDTHGLHLYGELTVFRDDTSFEAANRGGSLGYLAGSHGFADGTAIETDGIGVVRESASATHYLLVTDSGVRMQEHSSGGSHSAYLADGSFVVDDQTDCVVARRRFYSGTVISVNGVSRRLPRIADELWKNTEPDRAFSAQTIGVPGLSYYDIVIVEIAWSPTYAGVVHSAVVHQFAVNPQQGSPITAQPSILWQDSGTAMSVYRRFAFGSNSVDVSTGYRVFSTAVSESASHAIPIRIMGIMV